MYPMPRKLSFYNLDFIKAYHNKECVDCESETIYKQELDDLDHEMSHVLFGDRIPLEATFMRLDLAHPSTYIVQILNSCKLWPDSHRNQQFPSFKHLHEFTCVVWRCNPARQEAGSSVIFEGQAEHYMSTKLFMILDHEMEIQEVHMFKNGHLIMLFDEPTFKEVIEESHFLAPKMDDHLTFHGRLWLGETVNDSLQSQAEMEYAQALMCRAYGLMDFARLRVGHFTVKLPPDTLLKRPGVFPFPSRQRFLPEMQSCSLLTYLSQY